MWIDITFTLRLKEYDYGDGGQFNKKKKQGKWVGSQQALLSTHFSF
jgi:hypothetical protein